MSERKMWKDEEDNMIQQIYNENCDENKCLKLKWSQVAQILNHRIVDKHSRTGKQCRQRWFNHLNPQIIKNKDLSRQEIEKLFELQDDYGNKWAKIANQLQGRTDNYLKNFFYSSLRRAIRQINSFLAHHKKKSNIKPFKQTILTKILKIRDQKYHQKLNIKNQKAFLLAADVKKMLIQLSYQQQYKILNQKDKQFRQKLVKGIQQFNKNCKKKKQKKIQQQQLKKQQNNQNNNNQNQQQKKKKIKSKIKSKKSSSKITKQKQLLNYPQKYKSQSSSQNINKQPDHIYYSSPKHQQSQQQLFVHSIIDASVDNMKSLTGKKQLLQSLQQQHYLKSPLQQYKKLKQKQIPKYEQSDFFRKSGVFCIDNQPRLLISKSLDVDTNKDMPFIYTFQTWKKNQNKGEINLFQPYLPQELIGASLMESINIGDNLPRMETSITASITDSSIFSKIFKIQKSEQANIN